MALVNCKECGNEVSKKATKCPSCGAPRTPKTSPIAWLVAGIFGLGFISALTGNDGKQLNQSKQKTYPKTYPTSNATYSQISTEIGCESKYSEDKKEDIFKSKYKNHWMTWTGVVVLPEADSTSLNVDNFGTQDLSVDFTDKRAGYHLTEDSVITVKFLMNRAGGCFLPFSGKQAVILK